MKNKILLMLAALITMAQAEIQAQTTFTKITTGAIVNDVGEAFGCAWGDYDGDGYLDVFVVYADAGSGGRNVLYHNNGNATFTPVASGPWVNDLGDFRSATWIDYDNDGNLDLSIVSAGNHNFLYHNLGNGTFSKVTTNAIYNDVLYHSDGASWADYDGDGFIDFFVANSGGERNFLYHNNGNDTFTKITSGAIVNDIGDSLSCAWADYDNDGKPDLFVSNFFGPTNFLYHNIDGQTFVRATGAVGNITTLAANSIGCAWGDYDNDGFLDLCVANDGVLNADGSPSFLFHNNTNGTFSQVTSAGLETGPAQSPSCAWGDYDNDGYLDLLVLNNNGFNFLYHNEGNGSFTRVTDGTIATDGGPGFSSSGCAWVDIDNDGFLDLFIANGAGPSATPLNNFLYHNEGNTNAWLKIKCVGTVSNRSAIGAKVRIKATIRGRTFWQMREVTVGDGFQSGSPLDLHFGLGDATNAETVRIEWPSGTVQEFQNVPAKQVLTITEPSRLMPSSSNGLPQFTLKGGRNLQYDILTSMNLTAWSLLHTLTITNLDGTAQLNDLNSPGSDHVYYKAVLQVK
jgi:hypothetical protein